MEGHVTRVLLSGAALFVLDSLYFRHTKVSGSTHIPMAKQTAINTQSIARYVWR